MVNWIRRFFLELQYTHARAGIDAMRMDIAGSAVITLEQEQAIARQQDRALRVLQRINALRMI